MDEQYDSVEWDERKNAQTRELRGLSFEFAARLFLGDFIEEESQGGRLREQRFIATGSVDDVVLTVVWTPRGRARRIISARYASRKERRRYGNRAQETQ